MNAYTRAGYRKLQERFKVLSERRHAACSQGPYSRILFSTKSSRHFVEGNRRGYVAEVHFRVQSAHSMNQRNSHREFTEDTTPFLHIALRKCTRNCKWVSICVFDSHCKEAATLVYDCHLRAGCLHLPGLRRASTETPQCY